MECAVCQVRSSMGYCVECRTLLCESCAVACDNCGKPMCPDHVNLTQGGRNLCFLCFEERARKRAEHETRHHHHRHDEEDLGDTSLSGLLAPPVTRAVDADEEDDDVPIARSYRPVRPWEISLYIAGVALLVMVVLLLFPSFRQIPLGGGRSFSGAYVALVVPVIALMWGVSSFLNPREVEHQPKSLIGIVASVAAIALGFVVLFTDPARNIEQQPLSVFDTRHDNMDDKQMEDWREDMLKRYRPPSDEE